MFLLPKWSNLRHAMMQALVVWLDKKMGSVATSVEVLKFLKHSHISWSEATKEERTNGSTYFLLTFCAIDKDKSNKYNYCNE